MPYQCECGGDGQVCWTCYEKAREALKAAHHALTTVHGLWATDIPKDCLGTMPHHFRIDKAKVLAQIEEAMGDG